MGSQAALPVGQIGQIPGERTDSLPTGSSDEKVDIAKAPAEKTDSFGTLRHRPLEFTPAAETNLGGKTHLAALVDGVSVGQLEFSDADQTMSVRLSSLLELLQDRFPPDEYESLVNSPAAMAFVPVDQLAIAGIPISYDPVYDELVLSTDVAADEASETADQTQLPSLYS